MYKCIRRLVGYFFIFLLLFVIFLPNASADYVDNLIGYEICITGVIFGGMALVFFFIYLGAGGQKAVEREKKLQDNIQRMQELQIKKLESDLEVESRNINREDGKYIPKFCPNCGEKITKNTIFCTNCGKKLR